VAPTDGYAGPDTVLDTWVRPVSIRVGGTLRVAGSLDVVQSGVIVLRHCCECRSPAFASHVHEIGATDGNPADVTRAVTTAVLPLLETKVCSQVANISVVDLRGVQVDLGETLEGALLVFGEVLEDGCIIPSGEIFHHVLFFRQRKLRRVD
jgi:hypothetical protein